MIVCDHALPPEAFGGEPGALGRTPSLSQAAVSLMALDPGGDIHGTGSVQTTALLQALMRSAADPLDRLREPAAVPSAPAGAQYVISRGCAALVVRALPPVQIFCRCFFYAAVMFWLMAPATSSGGKGRV